VQRRSLEYVADEFECTDTASDYLDKVLYPQVSRQREPKRSGPRVPQSSLERRLLEEDISEHTTTMQNGAPSNEIVTEGAQLPCRAEVEDVDKCVAMSSNGTARPHRHGEISMEAAVRQAKCCRRLRKKTRLTTSACHHIRLSKQHQPWVDALAEKPSVRLKRKASRGTVMRLNRIKNARN